MRKLRISQSFYDILINKAFDHFTILELREASFAHAIRNTKTDRQQAYKATYRQVERLVGRGLLFKSTPDDGFIRYVKTEAFYETQFDILTVQSAKQSDITDKTGQACNGATPQEMAAQLRELARKYQVDLLTCIGESEEYMRLYSDFPELKSQLEPQYLEARERSSKLLGKIKALDTVLAQLPQMANQ